MMILALRCFSLHRLAVIGIVSACATTALAAELETLLANPPVSGLLIVQLVRDGQAAEKGLREGDILQKYASVELKSVGQLKQVIAQREKQKTIDVELVRDGRTAHVLVTPGPLGVRTSRLEKGKLKWKPTTAAAYTPELSGLAGESWMIFELNGRHAGFERRALRAKGNGFEAVHKVAFVGKGFDERFDVTMQSGKGGPLNFQSLRFVSGPEQKFIVEAKREGSRIVGTRLGKAESVVAPADTVPSYAVADLAMTLPQRVGFTLGFNVFEEADFRVQQGHDLVCVARARVRLAGKSIEAWRFEDRHYGERTNQYWIDNQRKLVKVQWEGDASSLAATKEEALKGVPAKLVAFGK